RPAKADDGREEPLEERVAAKDRVRCCTAGVGEDQVAPVGLPNEAVGAETPEHLARCLGRDAEVTGDLGGFHVRPVAGHDAEREEILLRGAREVVPVVTAAHRRMVRGLQPGAGGSWRPRTSGTTSA